MTVNWDEAIESTNGYELQLLDRCYVKNGLPYKLIKSPAVREGGNDTLIVCRDDGSMITVTDKNFFGSVRNKPKIIERWIVLWKACPGAKYYDTEEEARQATSHGILGADVRGGYIKIQKVEWES